MDNTNIAKVSDFLDDTFLAEAKIIELKIPGCKERAIAIEIDRDNAIAAWELMELSLAITHRYPVIVSDCEYPETSVDWEKSMRNSKFFNRWSYTEDRDRRQQKLKIDPISIINRSRSFDVDKLVEEYDDEFYEQFDDREEIDELLQRQLDWMEEECGKAPTLAEVGVSVTGTGVHEDRNFQRWLFEWELANVKEEDCHDEELEDTGDRRDWFSHYNTHYALILLPTENSYDAFAYIHWYGASYPAGSDGTIAFFKRWYERYEAKLVCHYGTYLYFKVGKQPQEPLKAFDLAVEQSVLSDYSIYSQGYSLRQYARCLMTMDSWYLHERP